MKYTVDIEAGNAFAKSIPIASHGFGGAFRVPSGYEKPVLISGADGVGTPSAPDIKTGFSYPDGTLNAPPNP